MGKAAVAIKIVSGVVIAGAIARPGTVVEVEDALARELLQRGKAVLATADDAGAGDDPWAEFKVPDLKALAKERGIEGHAGMSRVELIAALEEQANTDPRPE